MHLYRYFVSQSSEFCHHNPLCCFPTSVYCFYCLFSFDSVRKLLDTPSYMERKKRKIDRKNHLLTPWCRTLFEKLTVTQLVKNYPAFLWDPKVHYRVYKSLPLDPILTQPNPVRPINTYLPKIHLNVILPPFLVVSYLRASQPKLCKHLSPPPCVPHSRLRHPP
jgi:hypothetical protein